MNETAKLEGTVEDNPTAGALDAIDDALGLGGDDAPDTEVSTPAVESDDADGSNESEGEGGDEPEVAEEGEAEPESEFNEDGTRKERNADGTFKKADASPKGKDPINDPIPKDLKKETSERMQSLVKIAKEVTAERDAARNDMATFVNGIQATGSSPEQYGEALSWLSLFNSPKPEARMEAYKLVKNVAERMATMLGIEHTAADPLANHADLREAVQKGQATLAMAREVARNRDNAKFTGEIQNTRLTAQQQQEQQQQEHTQAKADLNAFEAQMKLTDPLYDLKRAQIVPILKLSFQRIPRNQWAATFKEAYASTKVQPKGVAPKGKTPQPLRANRNPAGGQGRPAASALDAMNAALNGMAK
jgi:hypothetical protein